MSLMKIVAGIVGCGGIAKFHFSGLEKAGARIKWVCDLDESAARPWTGKTGAQYTADFADVVADPEVNTVVVTTISSVHKTVCLAAIDAGKAVICEKTLAENADDALEIVSRAAEQKTLFFTSYMKRYIPAMQKAKELLPQLGTIMSSHIRVHQPWGVKWDEIPTTGLLGEKTDGKSEVVRRYGGGILVCGGSHVLDLTCFFVGRPMRLYASMYTAEGMDFDLRATAMFDTANGPVLWDALAHPYGRTGFLRDGWDERVEINGVGGKLEVYSSLWNDVEHKASMLVHYDNATGESTEYRYRPESAFDRAVAAFCADISVGVQRAQSPVTGYDADELISHIKKSAALGQAVDVGYRI